MTDPAEPQNLPQPSQPAGPAPQPEGEQVQPPEPSPFARPSMDLVNKGEDLSNLERH
jgi:hypothetical protein